MSKFEEFLDLVLEDLNEWDASLTEEEKSVFQHYPYPELVAEFWKTKGIEL